jgi:hypothetical protein
MSAVIQRRNEHGVLLRYEVDVRRAHHDESKVHYTDRLRCGVIKSEREIFYMRVMLEALEEALSTVALDRFDFALRTIEATLGMARAELGLYIDDDNES